MNERQMLKYEFRKPVYALKIQSVKTNKNGSAIITPREGGYESFEVKKAFVETQKPSKDMVYIEDEDGKASCMPEADFDRWCVRVA